LNVGGDARADFARLTVTSPSTTRSATPRSTPVTGPSTRSSSR
jgi:hypothetical protein